jgi:hypothetical protein
VAIPQLRSVTINSPRITSWRAPGNSTATLVVDAAILSLTGLATTATTATTNAQTWMRRVEFLVTVAATTAVAGFRATAALWGLGNGAGYGGFDFLCDWGPATGVATTTMRGFCGMANSVAAPTDVEPSTQTNMIGMGWDAADANIQIMFAGAGAATKVDLGSSFPVPTVDRTKAYRLKLRADANGTTVRYEVRDLASGGATVSGTISANLPANTVLLAPRGWVSVGGTSSVVGIAFGRCDIQSDM